MVSDGGRVTSLIKVRKVPLIVLHCTFMEMNTAAARELGVQLGLNFTTSSFGFGIGGNNGLGQFSLLTANPGTSKGLIGAGAIPGFTNTSAGFSATNQTSIVANPFSNTPVVNQSLNSNIGMGVTNGVPTGLLSQAILLGAPGGATFSNGLLPNVFQAISNFASNERYRWSINPTVQGVIAHSRARVLAEPTLVTLSGERASFLAGGEIPILQSLATAGQAQQSVVFEPFGIRLNMIPVLLENGNINIQVAPEERIISNAITLNIPGSTTNVPGFTTRKAQTIVEMKPGQELFISGLISANHGREVTKTPLLGEVPVLGALYRSKAFTKNESELVVAVRPEVIIPGNPGQLKLPEEISRVEGPRDTNLLQVEPTVLDERYMTTGRAERTFKLPGTLPTGSPVPDSQ
jgi:pilus assembly protein CpaC